MEFIKYDTMDVNNSMVGNELLDRALLSLSVFFHLYN